jgi:hypothetical protein
MDLKQLLRPVFQWGSKGKGLFFTSAKLSKFLHSIGVEVAHELLEDYLKNNNFFFNGATTQYFIGFKGHYDARARAFLNLKPAPAPAPAPILGQYEAYMKPEYKATLIAYMGGTTNEL